MIKRKILSVLCATLLIGTVSFAADATVREGQKQVYTGPEGSTLTIQYPVVTVAGNDKASQLIAQYFTTEEAKAQDFFKRNSGNGKKLVEDKNYVVTLNDGKYLSLIDQGSLHFDKDKEPTAWKTGVTFDLETGKQLTWQDVVKPEDAKAFTLDAINQKIFLSKYKLSAYFNGLQNLPINYYLDKNRTIHFLFAQYEVAPYATGIVDINMGKQAK